MANTSKYTKPFKCPECGQGRLTDIPINADWRCYVTYYPQNLFYLADSIPKCPKCGKEIGVKRFATPELAKEESQRLLYCMRR